MTAMLAVPSHLKIIRPLAALLLMFWMAGLGCVIGCEMSIAAGTPKEEEAAAAAAIAESADSCPMASRDCCQKAEEDGAESVETTPKHTGAPSCCPLTEQVADAARKVSNADVPLAEAGSPLSLTSNSNPPSKLSFQKPPVMNKGSTHLRCCVFLI
jgi:hypothetical protein